MELVGITGFVIGAAVVVLALALFFSPLYIWHHTRRTADAVEDIRHQLDALVKHLGATGPPAEEEPLPDQPRPEEHLPDPEFVRPLPPKLPATGGRIPGPDLKPSTGHTGRCPDCGKRTPVDPAAPGLQTCEHCGAEFEVG